MIKILAVICLAHAPTQCRELEVSNSNYADLTMSGCLVGAPQIAHWMRTHPGHRLASWKCSIGGGDRRGA